MWLNELKGLYSEAWGPATPFQPGDVRSNYPAMETQDSLRYKGVFGAGDSPSNLANVSAGGLGSQSPFGLDEEEEGDMLLDFDKWWKMEGGQMNFPSPEIEQASKKLAHAAWRASKHFYDSGG